MNSLGVPLREDDMVVMDGPGSLGDRLFVVKDGPGMETHAPDPSLEGIDIRTVRAVTVNAMNISVDETRTLWKSINRPIHPGMTPEQVLERGRELLGETDEHGI